MEKESLDISVGTAPTEVINNYSDTDRDSLTKFDELINTFFAGIDSVLRRHMVSSVLHLKDDKKAETQKLRKCRKWTSKLLRRRLT